MNKRAYSFIALLFFFFAEAYQQGRDAFGSDFIRVFVPGLLLLNSLQWLVLPVRVIWKIVAFCSCVLVFSFLYFSYVRTQVSDIANFVTVFFLFIVAQNITFWRLTRDRSARTISVATNMTTLFIIILGAFLNAHAVVMPRFSGARLLLAPLAAMLVALTGAAYKWKLAFQLTFVVIIVQSGIGLFDVGQANNLGWMSICSVMVGFGALGFVVYWAKEWND